MKSRKRDFRQETSEPHVAPKVSFLESITRFWVTIFIIAIILYVAALLISRTDGFRGIVRQRLEMLSGMNLSIGRVHATPGLDLVLEDIRESVTNDVTVGRLQIKRVELMWRLAPLIRGTGWPLTYLHVENGHVLFAQKSDGTWTPWPDFHTMVSPWLEIPGVLPSNEPSTIDWMRREKVQVSLKDINLLWRSPLDGDPPAILIEGLDLKTSIVKPFSELVLWFDIKINRAAKGGVVWLRQFSMEWIRTADMDVVLRYNQQRE
ncbi:MAG TPA: hypothetical protein PJ991_09005 [Kiritimatiellia bacterium]|nr:hypothetical protein [Kiritimatiellia bacterium]